MLFEKLVFCSNSMLPQRSTKPVTEVSSNNMQLQPNAAQPFSQLASQDSRLAIQPPSDPAS